VEIITTDRRCELIVHSSASWKQFERFLNFVGKKLRLPERRGGNDEENYYHTFDFDGIETVLYYSNIFGISIYLADHDLEHAVQEKILLHIAGMLSGFNFESK
jgi:hypothetical protein